MPQPHHNRGHKIEAIPPLVGDQNAQMLSFRHEAPISPEDQPLPRGTHSQTRGRGREIAGGLVGAIVGTATGTHGTTALAELWTVVSMVPAVVVMQLRARSPSAPPGA